MSRNIRQCRFQYVQHVNNNKIRCALRSQLTSVQELYVLLAGLLDKIPGTELGSVVHHLALEHVERVMDDV